MSNCIDVDYGVPQGTVLGLALFPFYINCGVFSFVDDTMLYFVGTNLKKMVNNINRVLDT